MRGDDEYNIFDFVAGISEALDLVSSELNHHHKRVAYITHSLASEMGIEGEELFDIVVAAVLHDIGAFSLQERLSIHGRGGFEEFNPHEHAFAGYLLLRAFEPLKKSAYIIRYHHAVYSPPGRLAPRGSYVIGLADRLAIAMDDKTEILAQSESLAARIRQGEFMPEALRAFERLAEREYFWLDASSPSIDRLLLAPAPSLKKNIDLDTLLDFAKVMAQIIDFRSRFTAAHSSGVAAAALELARLFDLSPRECRLMEIAGYLHDIGKLAVPNEVLNKPGALGYEEVNVMRKHTYYTYHVLSRIKGLEDVTRWAAFHHERLDGRGYPFHIKADNFTKLARIMAVADIFTAVTEDRPYRVGMTNEAAMKVLHSMAAKSGIDRQVVELTETHFDRINAKRISAQTQALKDYEDFSANIALIHSRSRA
jgi:HD-GYP domain-containing protein (c-di-GMP phosphodiesterase class II)